MDITFKNVSFKYHLGTPYEATVLDHISLEIKAGKWIALIGRTGSGKSTLVQHCNGLLTPTKGVVQVGKHFIKEKQKHIPPLFKDVGMVFQFPEHQLFEETVEKEITFGLRNLNWDVHNIEQQAGKIMKKLGMPDSIRNQSPLSLSGGQKRKVALASVFVMEPQILILDEPTVGLDPEGKSMIIDLLEDWQSEDRILITITHDMDLVAEYADEVIVMDEGKVISHKSPLHLFTEDIDQIHKLNLKLPKAVQLVHELNQRLEKPIPLHSVKKKDIYQVIAEYYKREKSL